MIPKIIHQIWIGEKSPPYDLMDTWKNISNFEYCLWTEKELDKLQMISRDKYNYFYKNKKFYGCADIARIEILYQYGGLYIDADTKRLKDLPDIWFNYDFFAVRTHDNAQHWNYRVANGIIGTLPRGNIISSYRTRVNQSRKIEPCWKTIGGTCLTDIITSQEEKNNTLILEPYTFFPVTIKGKKDSRYSEAYAIHLWGSKTKKVYKS